jgi:hypothetical protein
MAKLIGRVIFQTAARGCVVKGQLVYLREFVVANSGEKDGWFSLKYAEGRWLISAQGSSVARTVCTRSIKSHPRQWVVHSDVFYSNLSQRPWNPTNGSWWIVQVDSQKESESIHPLPWVGFWTFRAKQRPVRESNPCCPQLC